MKRGIFLLLGVLALNTSIFAKTSVLVDFNVLKADGNGDPEATSDKLTQNMSTLVDYSGIAGSNFTENDRKVMRTSLAPANWEVQLNASAASVANKTYSFTREWHTKYVSVLKNSTENSTENSTDSTSDLTVLGVRIRFPESNFNSWALIKPPFEIPAYEDVWTDNEGKLKYELQSDNMGNPIYDRSQLKKEDKGTKFLGKGVVRNVGILKSLEISVYGCQFKNAISVILKDQNDAVTEIQMPQYLDFDGWRKITWTNPNYVASATNRDLYVVPMYPFSEPYLKINGFRIYRQGDQLGGDFVTYLKDVVITYDEALNTREAPIDHEEAWGILTDRREDAKRREFSKIGNQEILRYLERQKMDGYVKEN